jgi:MFS family permease
MNASPANGRFAAFRHRSYVLLFFARFMAAFAAEVISIAVSWQMFAETKSAFYLGLVGLVQFLPSLLLILVTGTVIDRYNRRAIVSICMAVSALCSVGLLLITLTGSFSPLLVFVILTIFGVERAFMSPAVSSLSPNLVPSEDLPNSFAWNSSSWQVASITGPVAGGLLYGVGASVAYLVALAFMIGGAILVYMIPKPAQKSTGEPTSWAYLLAGFGYIKRQKIVLGAISLDLFAVLLGGATALMPIYASEILVLGPIGLGILRAASGLGAVAMALYLAAFPIRRYSGVKMFSGVALFGAATIIFGVSTSFWLSVVALALMGAGDMISVYVRETLIALWTPDQVRGRVNAVNSVFIGASNELGEFRAGSMASLFGAVPAVVIGGLGTLAVSIAWSLIFPQLRNIDTLQAPEEGEIALR